MTTSTSHELEELLEIVRNLPMAHVEEVLDFARFLEWRAQRTQAPSEETLDRPSNAENEAWDALLASGRSKQVLSRLAAKAIEDDEDGKTIELVFDADDNLVD